MLYMKFIAALLGGVSSWGVTAAADGRFDLVEWFGLLGVIATALVVRQVTNKDPDDI